VSRNFPVPEGSGSWDCSSAWAESLDACGQNPRAGLSRFIAGKRQGGILAEVGLQGDPG